MRILFVIDGLGSGGAQRQIVTLACEMKSRGHSVEFFVYQPGSHFLPTLEEAEIEVKRFQKKSRYSFSPIINLRRVLVQGRYDIVVSFLETPSFYTEIAAIRITGLGVVVSERFMYPSGRLPFRTRILQHFHRLADVITVNSNHQFYRMVHEFPWMGDRIRAIYNGYDLDRFSPATNVGAGRDPQLRLLVVSSVSRKKNPLALAKALDLCVHEHGIDVYIDWVGRIESVGAAAAVAEEATEYLKANGVAERWRWLGERSDIPDLLHSHDALIHPSLMEGLPNTICEALSCGSPVLAGDVGDHRSLVEEPSRGFLFDPTDPVSIALAIRKFRFLDGDEVLRMGIRARAYAVQNLSIKRFADEYEHVFDGALL